jgi:hypothetical protein
MKFFKLHENVVKLMNMCLKKVVFALNFFDNLYIFIFKFVKDKGLFMKVILRLILCETIMIRVINQIKHSNKTVKFQN